MSLIRTTIDMPFLRKGTAFLMTFEVESADGSVVVPSSGLTLSCPVKSTTMGSTLASATITRVNDTTVTISMTSTQVDAVCAGLTFSQSSGIFSAKCVMEVTFAYSSPAQTIVVIVQPDVVQ